MARLRVWIAGAVGGCALIALAYLPPRGGAARGPRFATHSPEPTAARRRAQAIADEWRETDASLHLLEDRQHVKRDSSRVGPTIIFRGSAPSPAGVRTVEAVADTMWRGLGLGETKVRAVLVIALEHAPGAIEGPTPDQNRVAFLTPDSTDRTTCIAFLPANNFWTAVLLGHAPRHMEPQWLERWLQSGLGPCAFYAAYGTPGRSVRSWLAARNWDVALYLGTHGIAGERFSSLNLLGDSRYSWYWDGVYSFPPATVACLAGRSDGCRSAVLEGADDDARIAVPEIVRLEQGWWRKQRLLPGERFLADVARDVGRDRFQTFWTSPLPVDTALAAALRQPVGEWTERWERRFIQPIRLGAASPLGATLLALLLATLAVSAVALTASRRQVR